MIACSTFSPARNVRSITAPVRTFLSVVRTKAPPLPGLTCWNSTTWNRPSVEVERHAVLQVVGRCGAIREGNLLPAARSGPSGVGQRPAPVGGDDHGVLDADAAVVGQVHARLDGHDVARRRA